MRRTVSGYRAGSTAEELWCKCTSCQRDVRRDIGRAYARLEWRELRSKKGVLEPHLCSFEVVCCKICLVRRLPVKEVYGLESCELSRFVGYGAVSEYDDLLVANRVEKGLRRRLPGCLAALSLPMKQGVRKAWPRADAPTGGDRVHEIPAAFRRGARQVFHDPDQFNWTNIARIVRGYRTVNEHAPK